MGDVQQRAFRDLITGSWAATKGERPRFFAFIFLYIVAYSADFATMWCIGYTLRVLVQPGVGDQSFNKAMLGVGCYTLLRLTNTVCHHTARYLQNTVAYQARMNELGKVFSRLMNFPLRWHIHTHSGESLSKLHRSASAIDQMVGTYIWQVTDGVVKVVGATMALLTLDTRVALNVFVIAALTIFLMIFFNFKLRAKIRQNNSFANKISRICIDYLFNIVTVKTLALEQPAIKYLEDQRTQGLNYSRQISKYTELKWGCTGLGSSLVIGSSLAIYFLKHSESSGSADIAHVYVLLNCLERIFQAIGSFTAYYGGILEAATSYEDAVSIEQESVKIPPTRNLVPIQEPWRQLKIHEISASYEAADKRGLHGLELTVRRGAKIAIVGPSGGGKSTFLKTLAGVLDPDTFNVTTDLNQVLGPDQVASLCLLIPQEPEIFSESVLYNLTMGQETDSKAIDRYLSVCRLNGVLAKLPNGVHSELVEKGMNLSVGEKQRMALARGLLRASSRPILLLDEPTSSLDPATEKLIFRDILSDCADRTIITACHRLALVPLFDRIIYVSQGQVVEEGSFQDLVAKGGAFASAWEDYERREAKLEQPLALAGHVN